MPDRVIAAIGTNAPVEASQLSHNELQDLTVGDVHTQYAFLAGRSGGQTLFGGTGFSDRLNLRGSTNASLGNLALQSPIEIEVNPLATGSATMVLFDPNYEKTAPASDIILNFNQTVQISGSAYLFSSLSQRGVFTQSSAPLPAFSDFALFVAAPFLDSDDVLFGTLSATVLASRVIVRNNGLGGAFPATDDLVGMQFSNVVSAVSAGDTMTVTRQTAVVVAPKWNTDTGTSTANLGTIRGIHCQDVGVNPLTGSSAGTEAYTDYIGLDFADMNARTPSSMNVAVHSDLVPGIANLFLHSEGGARSVLGILNSSATTPAQITADQNNYAIPTGSSGRMVHRLSTDASRTITGILNEATGDAIWIVNIGSFDLVLAHQNVGSLAANRIISPTGFDLTLGLDEAAQLWYDQLTIRWRILFTTGA